MKLNKIKVKMMFILVLLIPNLIINATRKASEMIPEVMSEVKSNTIEIFLYGNIYEKIDASIMFIIGFLVMSILLDLIRRDLNTRRN